MRGLSIKKQLSASALARQLASRVLAASYDCRCDSESICLVSGKRITLSNRNLKCYNEIEQKS